MYPIKHAKLLRALVAHHGQYFVIKEILLCSAITEYKLLDNTEIEYLIEMLQDIYVYNYKEDEDEQRTINEDY